jgi:hypothetical protein
MSKKEKEKEKEKKKKRDHFCGQKWCIANF